MKGMFLRFHVHENRKHRHVPDPSDAPELAVGSAS